jgi:hypothetical protein
MQLSQNKKVCVRSVEKKERPMGDGVVVPRRFALTTITSLALSAIFYVTVATVAWDGLTTTQTY